MSVPKYLLEKPEPKKGEHIFDQTYLTSLALKWKEFSAKNRHRDAMQILEKIIIESTPMFERLAQHENFHRTVSLPILVSAAQEKVVKWLLHWKPKKGNLFTWFSLHADTPVLLADGTTALIKDLVHKHRQVDIMTWNVKRQHFEPKKIVDWGRIPSSRKEYRKLVITTPTGYRRPTYVTGNHPVLTQRGWVEVDSLTECDRLVQDRPRVTPYGKSVLIGMYLGDGSVRRRGQCDYFSVSHGKRQRAYNEEIKRRFRGTVCKVKKGTVYWNSFMKRTMDHSGGTQCYFNLSALWPKHRFTARKQVSRWAINNLDDVALAWWFQDDGSYSFINNAVLLATQGFTRAECEMLIRRLKSKFQIEAKFRPNHQVWTPNGRRKVAYGSVILSAKAANVQRFFRTVTPHMLPCFDYKLPVWARTLPRQQKVCVMDVPVSVPHRTRFITGDADVWEVQRRFKLGRNKSDPAPSSFKWKYDLTIDGNTNFFVGARRILVHNSKCSKNAFRSEVVKQVQFRRKNHVTGDNLEKFYGHEEHEVDKHDAEAALREKIRQITCRWGAPQEINALRFMIECVLDDNHNKHACIRAAAYAYGLPIETAKFFYNWVLIALRDALYDQAYLPLTDQELFVQEYSYTTLPDLLNIITWDQMRHIIAMYGGRRLKIPTIAQLAKTRENYKTFLEIGRSSHDGEEIAEIAKKRKMTARTATETYEAMVEMLSPKRAGEHYIYGEHDDHA